jgi:hypothetical protein
VNNAFTGRRARTERFHSTTTLLLFALAAIPLAAACASAGGAAGARGECLLSAEDSVYLSGGPVFRDCAVDQAARLTTPNAPIDYRPSASARSGNRACWLAELQFVVNAAGVPEKETAKIVRTTDPGFAEAVLSSLPSWRYRPAEKEGIPVRQIVRERRAIALAVVAVGSGQSPRPPTTGCR